jgi:hypothetical protein
MSRELTYAALNVLAFPKPVRMEDPEYQRFIRRQPCVNDGTAAEAAHIIPAGHGKTGSKVSDYRLVPLCARCHRVGARSLHYLGRERFEKYWNIDLDLVQIQYLEMYVSALKDGTDLGRRA